MEQPLFSNAPYRLRAIRAVASLLCGLIASYRLLLQPGLIGLVHDWSIPPFDSQIIVFVHEMFDGWHHAGMGSPVVYPSEYPLQFFLGLLAAMHVPPDVLSKGFVFAVPAISFFAMSIFAERIGLKPPASFVTGAFYALSPVLFSKVIAGQLAYLFAYALFPVVLLACLKTFRRNRRRDWLLLAALIVLVTSQIQLGLLVACLVAWYALLQKDLSWEQRAAVIPILCLCVLGEMPVVLGFATQASQLESQVEFTPNLSWLGANSMFPIDAIRFLGYVAKYFDDSVRPLGATWQIASGLLLVAVAYGFYVMPGRLRLWCGVPTAVALIVATGTKGFVAPVVIWLFLHVGAVQVFRELYHLMILPAVGYSIALGFCFQRAPGLPLLRNAFRALVLVVITAFLWPIFSGNFNGLTRAFPIAQDLGHAYERFGASSERVAWFPMEQPLSFEGAGAGSDPMDFTAAGSLYEYLITWPLTAVDIDVRTGRRSEATNALRALSVGTAVFRKHFKSEVPQFEFNNVNLWHTFADTQPLDLAVGKRLLDDGATTAYGVPRPLPLRFTSDAFAYVPRRLDAIGEAASSGYVPMTLDTTLPRSLRYAMYVDDDDVPAASTEGYPVLSPAGFGSFDARFDFAPMGEWYFYRPAYADSTLGLMTIGSRDSTIPLGPPMHSAVLVVGWITTPVGGRLSVRTGSVQRIFDTRSGVVGWHSEALPLGTIQTGQTLDVNALDVDAEVAVRVLRVLSADDYARATRRLGDLLRGASPVYHTQAFSPFRAVAAGRGSLLPPLDADRNLRLTVQMCAPAPGLLSVVDPNGYILASQTAPAGCHANQLGFDGSQGSFQLSVTAPVLRSWRLESRTSGYRAAAPPGGANRHVGAPVSRLLVLNEAFDPGWTADGGTAHLRTAIGTNAWIVPARTTRAASITFAPAELFHICYFVGLVVIALGFLAPLLGALVDTRLWTELMSSMKIGGLSLSNIRKQAPPDAGS